MKGSDTGIISIIIRFIFLGCFFLFAVGVAVVSWIQTDTLVSEQENRNLKIYNSLTEETLVSGEWFVDFEEYCKDQVVSREQWISNYYAIQDFCMVRERNGYVLGEDSHVLQVIDRQKMQESTESYVANRLEPLKDIKQETESYGGKLIYLNIPHKIELYSEKYPAFYDGYDEVNTDRREQMILAAGKEGITCVETYDLLREHKDEYIYYVTDHHYSVKGAYYVYNALLDKMNEEYGENLTYPGWDDLDHTVKNERMVGAYLRKFGDSGRIKVDHMEYAIPKDMPEYERWDNGEASDAKLFSVASNAYTSFMSGDKANTVIKTYREDLPSVLYIGYSYTNALEMMSVYNFNEMHSIDPRHWKGNICDYIKEAKVDYVVVVRDDLFVGNQSLKSAVR